MWNDIPDLPSLENPNNNFNVVMSLQESLGSRPFVYPNCNLTPLLPASTTANVLFPAPANLFLVGNSSASSHEAAVLPAGMQCSAGWRKRRGTSRENDHQNNSDRRHQRLIRNRESAARSRDRKEARTAELEDEMKKLKAENAELKHKQKLMEAAKALKKLTLNRSSSSPF